MVFFEENNSSISELPVEALEKRPECVVYARAHLQFDGWMLVTKAVLRRSRNEAGCPPVAVTKAQPVLSRQDVVTKLSRARYEIVTSSQVSLYGPLTWLNLIQVKLPTPASPRCRNPWAMPWHFQRNCMENGQETGS